MVATMLRHCDRLPADPKAISSCSAKNSTKPVTKQKPLNVSINQP